MKKLYFFLFVLAVFASCKAPMPFYFDKPIGEPCDSFPKQMRGDFFAAGDEVLKDAITENGKYVIRNDTIFLKSYLDKLSEELKSSFDKLADSLHVLKKKDSIKEPQAHDTLKQYFPDTTGFHSEKSFVNMNPLAYESLGKMGGKEQEQNSKFGFFHIEKQTIAVYSIDKDGQNHRYTIVTLGNDVKLCLYQGKYFLNIRSPEGWEIMMFDQWQERFLYVVPLYITSYNDAAKGEIEFMNSVKDLYPGLKPVYNSDKQIAGVKAKMTGKAVLKLFESSEEKLLLLKQK